MKRLNILVISNLYPPYYIGGYELFCKDVVDELTKRGHAVRIITSQYKNEANETEKDIVRALHLLNSFEKGERAKYTQDQLESMKVSDQSVLLREIESFRPDLLYVWHMANLHKNLMNTLIHSKIPIVYHLEDRWIPSFYYERFSYYLGIHVSYLRYFLRDIWSLTDFIPILKKVWWRFLRFFEKRTRNESDPLPRLTLRRSIFLSKALRDEHRTLGFDVRGSIVVPNGINVHHFERKRRSFAGKNAKLLYVGRVAEKKGVQTLVKVLKLLRQGGFRPSLSIVGDTEDPSFLTYLKRLASEYQVSGQIRFVGGVKREEMSSYYHTHDILLFPSIWEEPFGLVLIEAMAARLPIVSTRTGGTKDFLRHKKNALIFEPMDTKTAARHILTLLTSERTYLHLSEKAYAFVQKNYDLETSVDAIEKYLSRQVKKP
ncbi:MAG TPA: glycosyltransferase family 4 protein [Patescibacteria group bacterium]|nr:glycosyltransferase family 4 protein [Patescibacteria group bacterium]